VAFIRTVKSLTISVGAVKSSLTVETSLSGPRVILALVYSRTSTFTIEISPLATPKTVVKAAPFNPFAHTFVVGGLDAYHVSDQYDPPTAGRAACHLDFRGLASVEKKVL
jgi:hypothetical protein